MNIFDLLVVFGLFGMFLLGFIQRTIRRVLGLAAILFSFLFASTLRDGSAASSPPTGTVPAEYSGMLGFGTVFVVGTIAFSLVIQGFYKQPLFPNASLRRRDPRRHPRVVQGLLILCITIILDSFFAIPPVLQTDNEIVDP